MHGHQRTHSHAHTRTATQALRPGGLFTIVTDNQWYARLLLHTAVEVIDGDGAVELAEGSREASAPGGTTAFRSFAVDTRSGGGAAKVYEVAGSVTLYEGDPGTQCGHDAAASSYFDRLWQKDDKYARYFLCLSKGTRRAGSKISAKGSGGGGKKRVFNDAE